MVQGLQPAALPPLRGAYCGSVNGLLRRELRAVAAGLRRGGDAAGGPGGTGKGGSPGGGPTLGPGSLLHSWRCRIPLLLLKIEGIYGFANVRL